MKNNDPIKPYNFETEDVGDGISFSNMSHPNFDDEIINDDGSLIVSFTECSVFSPEYKRTIVYFSIKTAKKDYRKLIIKELIKELTKLKKTKCSS